MNTTSDKYSLSHQSIMGFPDASLYLSRLQSSIVGDLPEDILKWIIEKFMNVACFDDYLRFGGTCKYFRSFAREKLLYQRPWLMLPNRPGDKMRTFYSPLENKVYNLKLPKLVRRSSCCGSYEGWLIFAHKSRGNFIYNPITKKRIRLPTHQVRNVSDKRHIKNCPYFLDKVVLSAAPPGTATTIITSSRDDTRIGTNSPPLMAAAITNSSMILLTFYNNENKWHQFSLFPSFGFRPFPIERFGDEEEEVELKFKCNERNITDVVFYKGKFYVIDNNGDLIIIAGAVGGAGDHNFSLRKFCMTPLKLKRKDHSSLNYNYLVESRCGELLRVLRIRKQVDSYSNWWRMETMDEWNGQDEQRMETKKFLVFRLESDESRWVEVESLGDQVLVLGRNCSKSVSSGDLRLPAVDTRRQNCIYFTDDYLMDFGALDLDYVRIYSDMGVYHLEDGSIDKLVPTDLFGRDYFQHFKSPPIMFTPNPW